VGRERRAKQRQSCQGLERTVYIGEVTGYVWAQIFMTMAQLISIVSWLHGHNIWQSESKCGVTKPTQSDVSCHI
jgi:hypothetical protein